MLFQRISLLAAALFKNRYCSSSGDYSLTPLWRILRPHQMDQIQPIRNTAVIIYSAPMKICSLLQAGE